MMRSEREMLERIRDQSGTLLALQITASGGRAKHRLERLIAADYAEIVDHPTVKVRPGGKPEAAVAITELGRQVLDEDLP